MIPQILAHMRLEVAIPTTATLPEVGRVAMSNDGHQCLVTRVSAIRSEVQDDFYVIAGAVLVPAARTMGAACKTQVAWMVRLAGAAVTSDALEAAAA